MNCKICDNSVLRFSNSHLSMLVPIGYPLSGELTLNICKSCQFVSNLSSNTEANYLDYYTKLNKHQAREGDLFDIDKDYFSEIISYVEENSDFEFAHANILDFGSGALLFSELANEAGAKLSLNFDVGNSSLSGIQFDLVISTHTFEHLLYPIKDFENLLNLLSENGYIAIAVSDLSGYGRAYYGPYAHFDLEHINHFSAPALEALFERFDVDVLSIRRGERRVTPTLAYSEVLFVGKKRIGAPKQKLELEIFAAEDELKSLVERYEIDFKMTIDAFEKIIEQANSIGKYKISFYGLSSYAFRLLHVLDEIGLLEKVDFYGDSDSRLSVFRYGVNSILQKNEFYRKVKDSIDDGFTVYVVVFAINSYRIVEMLQEECKFDRMNVIALPPDSQNRKDIQ